MRLLHTRAPTAVNLRLSPRCRRAAVSYSFEPDDHASEYDGKWIQVRAILHRMAPRVGGHRTTEMSCKAWQCRRKSFGHLVRAHGLVRLSEAYGLRIRSSTNGLGPWWTENSIAGDQILPKTSQGRLCI